MRKRIVAMVLLFRILALRIEKCEPIQTENRSA